MEADGALRREWFFFLACRERGSPTRPPSLPSPNRFASLARVHRCLVGIHVSEPESMAEERKRVLVVGGSSYLGQHLLTANGASAASGGPPRHVPPHRRGEVPRRRWRPGGASTHCGAGVEGGASPGFGFARRRGPAALFRGHGGWGGAEKLRPAR
ncbi:hypothetical protein ACP70R_033248 [Stipagrostis hirtigluma subsp. patula]